ncbi:peroxisome biogenesis factor 6 isoform X3 [Ranitomeya variabilis]|uniref:peroxisome biogenesis factor 6 isoform X3 n=1 Tax=Ranitomeya variabilis TaxID=490064 RepID=UPI004056E684
MADSRCPGGSLLFFRTRGPLTPRRLLLSSPPTLDWVLLGVQSRRTPTPRGPLLVRRGEALPDSGALVLDTRPTLQGLLGPDTRISRIAVPRDGAGREVGPPVLEAGAGRGPPVLEAGAGRGPPVLEAGAGRGPPVLEAGAGRGPPVLEAGAGRGPPVLEAGAGRGPPVLETEAGRGPPVLEAGAGRGPPVLETEAGRGPPVLEAGAGRGHPVLETEAGRGPPVLETEAGRGPPVLETEAGRGPPVLETEAGRGPPVLETEAGRGPPVLETEAGRGPPVLETEAGRGPPVLEAGAGRGHPVLETEAGRGPPVLEAGAGRGPPVLEAGAGRGPPELEAGRGHPVLEAGRGPPVLEAGAGRGPPVLEAGAGRGPPVLGAGAGRGPPVLGAGAGRGPPELEAGRGPPVLEAGRGPPVLEAGAGRGPPVLEAGAGRGPPVLEAGAGRGPPVLGAGAGRGPPELEAGRGPPVLEAGRGPPVLEAGRGPPVLEAGAGRGPPVLEAGRGPPLNQREEEQGPLVPHLEVRRWPLVEQEEEGRGPCLRPMAAPSSGGASGSFLDASGGHSDLLSPLVSSFARAPLPVRLRVAPIDAEPLVRAGRLQEVGGPVDRGSALWVSKKQLRVLGLYHREWVWVSAQGVGRRHLAMVVAAELCLGHPHKYKHLLSCPCLAPGAEAAGTAVISATLAFNLSRGTGAVSEVLIQRFHTEPTREGRSALVEPPVATLLHVSVVKSPAYNSEAVFQEALCRHFQTPRAVQVGDILCVSCFSHSDFEFNKSQMPVRFPDLYFKVQKIDGEHGSDGYIADSIHSTLYQVGSVCSFVPSFPSRDGHVFWSSMFPAGLSHTVDDLCRILLPHLQRTSDVLGEGGRVLLTGPKGSGKTTVVRATCSRLNLHLYQVECARLCRDSSASSIARLHSVFSHAQDCGACVLLLCHLDLLGKDRDGSGEDTRVISALCSLLHGTSHSKLELPFLVVATTSRAQEVPLDLQSCFLHEVCLNVPTEEQRLSLLTVLSAPLPLSRDVDLARLASSTAGFVVGDLCALLSRAGRISCTRIRSSCVLSEEEEDGLLAAGFSGSSPSLLTPPFLSLPFLLFALTVISAVFCRRRKRTAYWLLVSLAPPLLC